MTTAKTPSAKTRNAKARSAQGNKAKPQRAQAPRKKTSPASKRSAKTAAQRTSKGAAKGQSKCAAKDKAKCAAKPNSKCAAKSTSKSRAKDTSGCAAKRPSKSVAKNAPAGSDPDVSPLDAYRLRMRLIGDLLNAALGGLADTSPGCDRVGPGSDRVGRGAYLHIMGQVFEALDGLSQAVPLDDLVRLSRIVAEQRRAELNTRKLEALLTRAEAKSSRKGTANANPNTGGNPSIDANTSIDTNTSIDPQTSRRQPTHPEELPAHFNAMVRRLYGVTIADDSENPTTDTPPQSEPGV
jgi:hypothetical protein